MENGPPGPPGLHDIYESEVRDEYRGWARNNWILLYVQRLFWSGCGPELDILAKTVPRWYMLYWGRQFQWLSELGVRWWV